MGINKCHKTVSLIINLLADSNVWFETFEHKPARTSQGASNIRTGYKISQGTKAIILRLRSKDGHNRFGMVALPGDKRFDNEKVKSVFGVTDIRFATEEEVFGLTSGILPRGVPPFGNLFDLQTIVDPLLLENNRIVFNAGDKRFSIGLESKGYVKLVNPMILEII